MCVEGKDRIVNGENEKKFQFLYVMFTQDSFLTFVFFLNIFSSFVGKGKRVCVFMYVLYMQSLSSEENQSFSYEKDEWSAEFI